MSRATPQMRAFAERLIAYETKEAKSAKIKNVLTFLVIERLRPHLATLMGSTGFRALLSRALTLAGAEVPWLRVVHVKTDGSLEEPEGLETQTDERGIVEGKIILLAQLLGLLAAFIGESLTVQLVLEVWPNLPLNNLDFGKGHKNEKTK